MERFDICQIACIVAKDALRITTVVILTIYLFKLRFSWNLINTGVGRGIVEPSPTFLVSFHGVFVLPNLSSFLECC